MHPVLLAQPPPIPPSSSSHKPSSVWRTPREAPADHSPLPDLLQTRSIVLQGLTISPKHLLLLSPFWRRCQKPMKWPALKRQHNTMKPAHNLKIPKRFMRPFLRKVLWSEQLEMKHFLPCSAVKKPAFIKSLGDMIWPTYNLLMTISVDVGYL